MSSAGTIRRSHWQQTTGGEDRWKGSVLGFARDDDVFIK